MLPHLERAVRESYGPDPAVDGDYGRIVTRGHAERLAGLLEGQPVAVGGTVDVDGRHIAPTIVPGADPDSPLMREEIFGPILPSCTWARRGRRSPSSGSDPIRWRCTCSATTAGCAGPSPTTPHRARCASACRRRTWVPGAPVRRVGASGMGAYHGERSFDTFSHDRSVLHKPLHPDTARLLYPPYRGWGTRLIVRLFHGTA
nr:aldehyde dehydrogenase family protein [Tessaracoccus coleopterorum]